MSACVTSLSKTTRMSNDVSEVGSTKSSGKRMLGGGEPHPGNVQSSTNARNENKHQKD